LLALFFDAKEKSLVARRLVHLAQRLRPGDVRPSEASKIEVSGDITTETGRARPRKPMRKKK
jgi:hypothetical protein